MDCDYCGEFVLGQIINCDGGHKFCNGCVETRLKNNLIPTCWECNKELDLMALLPIINLVGQNILSKDYTDNKIAGSPPVVNLDKYNNNLTVKNVLDTNFVYNIKTYIIQHPETTEWVRDITKGGFFIEKLKLGPSDYSPTKNYIKNESLCAFFKYSKIEYFEITTNMTIKDILIKCCKFNINKPLKTNGYRLFECESNPPLNNQQTIKINYDSQKPTHTTFLNKLADINVDLFLIKDNLYLQNEFNKDYDFIVHDIYGVKIHEAVEYV